MDIDKRIDEVCSDIANEINESDRELVERLMQARRDGMLCIKWSAWSPLRNWQLPDHLDRLLALASKGLAAEGLVEAAYDAMEAIIIDPLTGGKDMAYYNLKIVLEEYAKAIKE